MKLIEQIEEEGSLQDALWQMMADVMGVELDDDQITELSSDLTLSDMLALDKAWTDNDATTIRRIFKDSDILDDVSEAVMQGRTGVASAASSRPVPARKQLSQPAPQPQQQQAAQPVAPQQKYNRGMRPQQQQAATESIDTLRSLAGLK